VVGENSAERIIFLHPFKKYSFVIVPEVENQFLVKADSVAELDHVLYLIGKAVRVSHFRRDWLVLF
jgi:hypothetical protein